MDKLDFLDGQTPEPTAAVSQPEPPAEPAPAAEPVAQTPGQPRAPDGKFAPKSDAAPAEPVAAQPAPQAPAAEPQAEQAKAPEGYVPLAAFMALRDDFNSFKRSNQQPATPRIQPGEEGFEEQQHYEQVREAASAEARLNLARDYATEKHGEEKVQEAIEWGRERAEADPVFRQQSWSAKDPIAFAIQEKQRHEGLNFAAQLFADQKARDDFDAWRKGQAPTPAAAPVVVAAPPSPSPPPRSLAAVPNAGGTKPGAIPIGPGVAFDNAFKD
jgi:hypothetical protein